MTGTTPPVAGAALPIALLAEYREWLIDSQRDLEIQDAIKPDVLDGDWRALVREARALLDGYSGRLGIHGPFDGLPLMSRDPKQRDLVSSRLCQGLAFAAELGATHMVVHSPFIFFGSPFVPHTPGTGLSDQIELVHLTLDPVVALAEQVGCTLVIENILDTNPAPLLALVRSFETERVRMSLDTGHAFVTHQRGGPPPDQWVREAGALLAHLHLQDTDGNYDYHWAPGEGSINWVALFEALGQLQHTPRLILELRRPAHMRQRVAWLAERGLAR